MIINIVKEKTNELVASIDTEAGDVVLRNGYDICSYTDFLIKNGKAFCKEGMKRTNIKLPIKLDFK